MVKLFQGKKGKNPVTKVQAIQVPPEEKADRQVVAVGPEPEQLVQVETRVHVIKPEPAQPEPVKEDITPVFVFGSNLAGIHGAGSALFAKEHRQAQQGVGVGRTGNAYAIPTKDRHLRSLPLDHIAGSVKLFLDYARDNPHMTFEVVKIGCGLAGYKETTIAPMFSQAPENCMLPPGWRP